MRTLFQIEIINQKCGRKSGAAGKSPKRLKLIYRNFFQIGFEEFLPILSIKLSVSSKHVRNTCIFSMIFVHQTVWRTLICPSPLEDNYFLNSYFVILMHCLFANPYI